MKRITALILAAVLCFGLLSAAVSGEVVPVPETAQVHKIAFSTLEALASKGDDELVAVNLWLRGPSREALEAMTPVEKPGSDATTEERNAYASAYAQTKESVYSGIMSAFVRKYLDETEQVLQEEYDSAPGIGVYVHKRKLAALEALDEVIWINKIGRSIILVEEPAPEEKLAEPLREYMNTAAPDAVVPVRIWLRGPSVDEFQSIVSAEYPTLSSPPEAFQAYRTAREQAANELGNDLFMYRLFMDNHREDFSNILFESDENFPVLVATVRADKIESLAALKMVSQIDTAFGYDEALPDPELPEDPAQRKKIEKQLQKFMNIAGHDELIPIHITLKEPADIAVLSADQGDRAAQLQAQQEAYTALTTAFVENHLEPTDEVFFKGKLSPFVTAEVAKHKIAGLAALDEVTSIDWALGHDDEIYSDDGKDCVYATPLRGSQPPALDKSALAEAIETALALDLSRYNEREPEITDVPYETEYTPESFAAFKEAVEAAKAVLAKEDATQEEIDAAAKALANAIADAEAHMVEPLQYHVSYSVYDLIEWIKTADAKPSEEWGSFSSFLNAARNLGRVMTVRSAENKHLLREILVASNRDYMDYFFQRDTDVFEVLIALPGTKDSPKPSLDETVSQRNASLAREFENLQLTETTACVNGEDTVIYYYDGGEYKKKGSGETMLLAPTAFFDLMGYTVMVRGIGPRFGSKWENGFLDLFQFHEVDLSEMPFRFDDVRDEGKFYFDAVYWAYGFDPQITNGLTKTTFGPNESCTRGQVVTFLWRAAGCPEPKSKTNPFEDVKQGAFYYKAVLWAVENEITNGMTKTTFGPNQACTRGQIVTFIYRAKGYPGHKYDSCRIGDFTPNDYYYDAILWAVENKVTNGIDDTHFGPDRTCTRGQVVAFLYRAKQALENSIGE